MISLRYQQHNVTDFEALVGMPHNLASPSRSTVPHLTFWSDISERLRLFTAELGSPVDCAELIFEYTVSPPRGQGKASHTDLMIVTPTVVIGTEAKYTENDYDSVETWLGNPATQNKLLVLQGWLDLIALGSGCQLTIDQVRSCTYQLIHRTASVCSVPAEKRVVVYHCFDLPANRRDDYVRQFQSLAALLPTRQNLEFVLYTNNMIKSNQYQALQNLWAQNRQIDHSAAVRDLLINRQVANFADPVITIV